MSSPASSEGSGGGGGGGDEGGAGGGTSCAIDPPGEAFSIRVINGRTTPFRITLGCGDTFPITIDAGSGQQAISPGQVDVCEVTCDSVYSGNPNFGCSDCGPGGSADLDPGGETTIVWDRRVYTAHTAPEACSEGSQDQNSCALGTLVPSTTIASGQLRVCIDEDTGVGWCSGTEETIEFELDLSKTEVVISVQ